MASLCLRFVQPPRACAGVVRTNRPPPLASGSESEGRRGLSLVCTLRLEEASFAPRVG
jgi:hypothetical protein